MFPGVRSFLVFSGFGLKPPATGFQSYSYSSLKVTRLPQGYRLLCWELSEASPGLYALPRSKPLRFRYLGTPQRCRLGCACVLCPSQVQAAQVTRCLASVVTVIYCLPPSLPLGFLGIQLAHLLRQMLTVQNPKKSWLAMKPACSLVDNASLGP